MKKAIAILLTLMTFVSVFCSCSANSGTNLAVASNKETFLEFSYPIRKQAGSIQWWRPKKAKPKPHKGIDLSTGKKDPIYSIGEGTIAKVYTCPHNSKCDCNYSYGNGVVIKHTNGKYSHYAHLSSVNVKVGDNVTATTIIGYEGASGKADGIHLHFGYADGPDWNSSFYDPFQSCFYPWFSIKITNNDKGSTNPKITALFPSKDTEIKSGGIKFGTSSGNLSNSAKDSSGKYAKEFFDVGSKFGNLTNGNTYYFQLWLEKSIDGWTNTYYSPVYSFKSGEGNVSFLDYAFVDECLLKGTTDVNKLGKTKTACQLSTLPHDPQYNASAGVNSVYIDGAKIPKGEKVKLLTKVNNGHDGKSGNDWYKAEYNGYTGYIWSGNLESKLEDITKATPKVSSSINYYNTGNDAAITLNGGTLTKGTGVRIGGTLSSNVKMKRVYFVAKNASNNSVALNQYEDINSTSYTFRKAGNNDKTYLNYKLSFKSLAAGKYNYQIYVTTDSNDVTVQTGSFTVKEPVVNPTVSFSPSFQLYNGSKYVAFTLNNNTKPLNKSCSVQGKLTSTGKKIVSVKADIKSSNGSKTYCSKEMSVSASYNVTLAKNSALDQAMTFKSLAKGNYKFNLYVKLQGESSYRTVATYSFKVA